MIIYKLLAGRSKDIEDAENIYSNNNEKINETYIITVLKELSFYLENNALHIWNTIANKG